MDSKTKLAEKLKSYRKAAKLTQKQVADALGIQRSAYAYYEIDKTAPKLPTLLNIAKLYKVSVDDLIGDPEEMAVSAKQQTYTDKKINNGLVNDSFNDLSSLEKSVVLRLRIMSAQQRKEVIEQLFKD